MTVWVVMSGMYDNYGLYGVYESRQVAEAIASQLEYSEVHEEEVRGMPQPESKESQIAIARRELGLPTL